MSSISFLTLFVAAFVNAVLPGPCVLLTLSRSARSGAWAGITVTGGILAADLLLVSIAASATLGTIAIAPQAFPVMKWVGVASLVGLAALTLRTARHPTRARAAAPARDSIAGFMVGASSPYNLVFYLALFPQVVSLRDPPSALIAGLTVMAAITLAQVGVVVAGVSARGVAGRPGRWIDLATAGALLILATVAANMTPMAGKPPVLTTASAR